MESIIKKLYYGEIRPCEKSTPNTERFIENRKTICSTEEQILKLFPECEDLLNQYTEALRIESQLECEADFAHGFQLGARIMHDVMTTE